MSLYWVMQDLLFMCILIHWLIWILLLLIKNLLLWVSGPGHFFHLLTDPVNQLLSCNYVLSVLIVVWISPVYITCHSHMFHHGDDGFVAETHPFLFILQTSKQSFLSVSTGVQSACFSLSIMYIYIYTGNAKYLCVKWRHNSDYSTWNTQGKHLLQQTFTPGRQAMWWLVHLHFTFDFVKDRKSGLWWRSNYLQ